MKIKAKPGQAMKAINALRAIEPGLSDLEMAYQAVQGKKDLPDQTIEKLIDSCGKQADTLFILVD